MNTVKKIAAALAMFGAASSVSATPIPDGAGVATAVTFAAPYSYNHDILDHGFLAGGNIASAILSVWLTDPNKNSESANVTIGIGNQFFTPGTNNDVNNGNGNETRIDVNLNNTSLDDLMFDGLLGVIMSTNNGGDYTFLRSTLNFEMGAAAVPGNGVQVPEPLTLGLMGIGLAGLAAARRRKH
ncbi:MAG: PEP-CTERM sorting domain-containing protein [Telluria sp.]